MDDQTIKIKIGHRKFKNSVEFVTEMFNDAKKENTMAKI